MRKATLATGITVFVLSLGYLLMSFQYDMGTANRPGPGLYPMCVGCVLLLCSAGTVVSTFLNPPAGTIEWPTGISRWKIIALLVVTLFYALTIEILGYIICTSIIVFVSVQVMGVRSWPLKIGLTLAMTILVYILFGIILNLPLPRGLLYFL